MRGARPTVLVDAAHNLRGTGESEWRGKDAWKANPPPEGRAAIVLPSLFEEQIVRETREARGDIGRVRHHADVPERALRLRAVEVVPPRARGGVG